MNQPDSEGRDRASRILVMVPDEPGALAKVTEALGEAEINIEDIDGRRIGELGVITLRTSDDDAALHALQEANLRAITSDTVVFHLEDKPGALAGVARRLSDHGLNVRTIHIINRVEGHAIIALSTDDDEKAASLLNEDSLL